MITNYWTPKRVVQGSSIAFAGAEIEAFEREVLNNAQATGHDASRFFERIPKFLQLGTGAEIRREVVLMGIDQRVDFFRRHYGEVFWDIIELKGPHKRLLAGVKTRHPRLSHLVETAISQALDYRDSIERSDATRAQLERRGIRVHRLSKSAFHDQSVSN